jgi:hypothetical protein
VHDAHSSHTHFRSDSPPPSQKTGGCKAATRSDKMMGRSVARPIGDTALCWKPVSWSDTWGKWECSAHYAA